MTRDLMFQQEIKQTVEQAYAAIATGGGETVARQHYSDQAEVPLEPSSGPWGWATPSAMLRLQPGQVVLDVGSGGVDRHHPGRPTSDLRAGPMGWTSWRRCASAAGATPPRPGSRAGPSSGRGRWRTSRSPTRDVAISNGVLNLSGRKSRALAEIYRVLGPGGRMHG